MSDSLLSVSFRCASCCAFDDEAMALFRLVFGEKSTDVVMKEGQIQHLNSFRTSVMQLLAEPIAGSSGEIPINLHPFLLQSVHHSVCASIIMARISKLQRCNLPSIFRKLQVTVDELRRP